MKIMLTIFMLRSTKHGSVGNIFMNLNIILRTNLFEQTESGREIQIKMKIMLFMPKLYTTSPWDNI